MVRNLAELQWTLSTLLPDEKAIVAVTPMNTGFSNDTYLIEGPDLILRLPPAAGAMLDGHDVIGQARIYAALGSTPGAPPVPRIVHVEESADLLGAPFFIMGRVPGESVNDIEMQPWFTQAPDAVRRAMCRDWVSAFAGLARLAPLDVLGAPVSPEDDVRMWQRFAAAAQCPQLADMIERLLKTPAPISGPPAVIQGDSKLSNLMWDDFRMSAMLDWEMSLNGEPMADLGYMLYLFESEFHGATRAPKLPGMMKRAEVIALWEDVSGRSAAGIVWHEIAQIAKITAIIAEGTNMFNTGRSTDPKLAYFKQNLDYYLGVVAAMLAGSGH
ncbi:phosphotransferase family protein [Novosphingobium sp. MMS21-SN21R]|uniref:phosphotransferase family protein n=1 Tax=Novosphingobium sp. MMS21-SN21R TaxID=2969298 RepID=UPI002886AEDE|nr:phosphotransferase family protein [Novosphingobium sp. MMS21-SN21R]MDT0509929.1 phosphotransferase family protein [Novosphingobium sp. MMS21-SN21R]